MSEDPYRPPLAAGEPGPAREKPPHSEVTRRIYRSHEGTIKAMGLACYFIGAWLLALFLMFSGMLFSAGQAFLSGKLIAILFLLAGLLHLLVGFHLRKLSRPARIGAMILSFMSLLVIPVGTIYGILSFVVLVSGKNQMVFSSHYQDVMAATPEIKASAPLTARILTGILIALILAHLIWMIGTNIALF